MQILYWHLTRPQTSTCGGSTSPPLLQRRDGASLSPESISHEKSKLGDRSSEKNLTNNPIYCPPLLIETGDTGGSRRSLHKNMEIENDDQTPTFYLLNAVDVPVDDDAALNHHLELIHGQNDHDHHYNGPLVAVGNGSSGDGGNGNVPPGGHYVNQSRKGAASKRKKRRPNDLARVLCVEEDSDDDSAVNVGPSRSKKAKLIVNLYPEDKGYSFGYHVPGSNESSESHAIPYSERYLLDSIDAEQIPHKMICKFEDKEGVYLMRYRNQVIAEIRDYRKTTSRPGSHLQNISGPLSIPGRNSYSLLQANGSLSTMNGINIGNEHQKEPVVKQVMLRPTTESLLCDFDVLVEKGQQDRGGWNAVFRQNSSSGDVSHLIPDGSDSEFEYEVDLEASQKSECNYLTYDQRLELERKFVNQTAGPLCLDPSPQVGLIANRMQYEKLKWNTEEMKSASKRWEENPFKSNQMTISIPDVSLNAPSWAEGRLDMEPFYNFVMNVKAKRELRSHTFGVDKDLLRLPPIQYQDYPNLEPPKNIEEILRIGQIPEPAQLRVFPNENFVRKIEEYILETERRKRPHTTTLSIFQRNAMESYFGELEMESFLDPNQPRIGSPPASTKCQFELGSSRNVTLYVKQFSDIFTEDGRRPCKITYQKVGQPPQVVYTNSYKSAVPQTPPVPGAVAAPSTPPPSQTITAVTASVPQIITTLPAPIVVNTSTPGITSVAIATSVSSTIATAVSQICQASSGQTVMPATVTVPGMVSVTQQPGVQLQRPPTPGPPTNIIVAGAVPATSSTPTLPPVQIVHPQPRTTPQQLQLQQQQQQQQQKPQTTGQRQTAVQIFSQQPQTQNIAVPQTVTPAAANLNLNVNLNSPGIPPIVPQQVLTRPHIVNVNLQQQQQQAAAQQQLLQQITQQRILRMKQQQQPNTALAKLLLTNLQTKPITVAVQPTPQNPINVAAGGGSSSPVCSSSSGAVASCSSSTNATNNTNNASNAITSADPQGQQNPLGSPIMITSPPSVTSSMTNPSPNVNVNVNASPNVSVNLNTISLDGLLAASSANLNYGNATTITTNQAGSNIVATSNVNLGLSRITTSSGQPAVNILRLNNNSGTVATGAGGNTVQLAAVQRQLAVSNAINGNVSILQQGSQQPQQRILINANSMNNLNLNSVGSSGEMDELSVPDLTTLLGGQPIQISQLGQQQHILTNATPSAQSQTTIDTTNLNLNLNVNLNSGTVVNNGESQVQQHQIAKIQGGEWTTTAQAPPFLVFISPLRPMSIATSAQAAATRQVTAAGTVTNPSALSLNLGAMQQPQQVVQSQPGKVPEGPTRILLGTCNNGVAIKREVATPASTAPTGMASAASTVASANDNLVVHQNQGVETSTVEASTQLLDPQQVVSSSDVVVDGVDSLFNALSQAIGPEQLQKIDAIGGSLTAAASAASSNVAAPQIPSSAVAETISGMRVVQSSNAVVNMGGTSTTNALPSSSIPTISNNIGSSKSNNSTNVITLSDLLGSPTVVSSSAGNVNSYPPLILNSVNNNIPSSSSNSINSSPTLSSLLNSTTTSIGGGLSVSTSSASVSSAPATQSSIVSSTPRLSALLAGTPSADTVLVGTNGPSLLSPAGSADSSTSVNNSSASYGTLLDRLAASLNQPQGTTSQVRTGASRLNPIATATPSVVLDHPVLAATLTQQQPQPPSISTTAIGPGGVNRGSSTFRQIAPAPSPVASATSIGSTTTNNNNGNPVAVINASDVPSHTIQSPQLINLLGLVGNNTGGTGSGQTRTIRINASSPGNNPSPGSASR